MIMGEAGIGKTYLVEEFTRWARKGDITCLKTRSYPTADELAYTPVTGLLRNEAVLNIISHLEETHLVELARLLPELRTQYPDLPDPDRVSESWKRSRLFEASTLALLGVDNKLVIVLDDLQWCDRETLNWLRYLLEYKTETKVMIIAGVRTEDLLATNPLIPFFAELGGKGKISEILMNRLDLEGVHQLASDLWGEELEQRAAVRLYQETEGNPLFVAEMVRAGYLKDFGDGSDLSRMPPKVQAVIKTRLITLSTQARELASLASAIGRGFDFELLLNSGENKEDALLEGLDELWSRRLIKEEGEAGYNFSHDKFREVLYAEISPHRKIHYHKKIAGALEEIHQDQLEGIAPQLAYQYGLAGNKNKALDYYLMAGDQARLVFAQEEALEYYQAGKALLPKKATEAGMHLFSGLGNTLFKKANYDESGDTYQEMASIAKKLGNCEQEAQAWLAISKVKDRLADHQSALDCANIANRIAEKNKLQPEMANAIMMKGQQYYRLGLSEKADPHIMDALAIHQKNKDQLAIGRCFSLLGLNQDIRGDYIAAKKYKEKALEIFNGLDDSHAKWWAGNVIFNLAISADLQGDYPEAVKLYTESQEIMREFGDLDWMILSKFSMGAAKVSMGDYEHGQDELGAVLDLTGESGWVGLSLVYYYLAESYLGQRNIKYAEKSAREALEIAQGTDAQEHLGAAWRVLGKISSENGTPIVISEKVYSSRQCFEKSESIFREINGDAERAYTLKAWAEHERAKGDQKTGDRIWQEAMEIFQRLKMISIFEQMKDYE